MKKWIINFKLNIILLIIVVFISHNYGLAQNIKSISEALNPIYNELGIDSTIKYYSLLKNEKTKEYDFAENQLKSFGYFLIREEKYEDAIKIFQLNSTIFPNSYKALNNLALAYFFAKDYVASEKYYEIAFALNSDNYTAKYEIEKIYNVLNYEKKEFDIPMRDGVNLHTQIYIPRDQSKNYPFLINRTNYAILPYGTDAYQYKRKLGPTWGYSQEKYIFVYQNVRGRFLSEGKYEEMRPYKINKDENETDESSDIYDTIEWLLKNIDNSNGKVGLYGYSYPGFYSLMGLIDPHPALKAVIPKAPIVDWFKGDDFHQNGAFMVLAAINFFRRWGHDSIINTTKTPIPIFSYTKEDLYSYLLDKGSAKNIGSVLLNNKVPFWEDLMQHGNYDDFWQKRNISNYINKVNIPVLNVGGWFDKENIYGTLNSFKTIENKNPENKNSIIVGPWFHGGWYYADNSDYLGATDINVKQKSAVEFYKNIELNFLNYYLKDRGEWSVPKASMYDIGINKWRSFDQWPPEETETKQLFFREDYTLSFEEPNYRKSSSEYINDPFNPVPAMGKAMPHLDPDYVICEQSFAENRKDILVFKSEKLEEDMTIVGPIEANLFVSTSGTDSDWIIKVIDQFPEDVDEYENDAEKRADMKGYKMLLKYGVLRGKFRNSLEFPEPFIPNQITSVNFELHDVCHTFKKGHRIIIYVQSSMFPIIDRNPNKFMDIYSATSTDYEIATNRIFHSKKYPSHISIKILEQ
jgi:putative CocE/NonD family hydrolase